MHRRRFFLVLAALFAVSAATTACFRTASPIGVPLPRHSRFDSEWRNYSRLQPNKAMAAAGDMSGVYVVGYAFGSATEDEAVARALAACEVRRRDKRIDGACRTYAIGDHPIATASVGESMVR